ncbi:hypothetical protein ABH931_001060 [Streptacidiphilus sp. MAP12-33]|uniref:hypothetical protein n=1 Tax=Streptacidiphilus sp. MAP12-33 TaxID=3156266 RepID=UPI0035192D38
MREQDIETVRAFIEERNPHASPELRQALLADYVALGDAVATMEGFWERLESSDPDDYVDGMLRFAGVCNGVTLQALARDRAQYIVQNNTEPELPLEQWNERVELAGTGFMDGFVIGARFMRLRAAGPATASEAEAPR